MVVSWLIGVYVVIGKRVVSIVRGLGMSSCSGYGGWCGIWLVAGLSGFYCNGCDGWSFC